MIYESTDSISTTKGDNEKYRKCKTEREIMKFGLEMKPTEGEHAARIFSVKELPQQITGFKNPDGTFRVEDKVQIVFEMLDQQDGNGDFAQTKMTWTAKSSPKSHLGRFLDDMGWPRNGRDFNFQWLVGETLHINIRHSKDGKFADVTHAIKDPAIVREYRRQCSWTGCTEFVNPHVDAEVKSGRCYRHCYLKPAAPSAPIAYEHVICEHDDCTNNPTPGSKFCYRHGGEL